MRRRELQSPVPLTLDQRPERCVEQVVDVAVHLPPPHVVLDVLPVSNPISSVMVSTTLNGTRDGTVVHKHIPARTDSTHTAHRMLAGNAAACRGSVHSNETQTRTQTGLRRLLIFCPTVSSKRWHLDAARSCTHRFGRTPSPHRRSRGGQPARTAHVWVVTLKLLARTIAIHACTYLIHERQAPGVVGLGVVMFFGEPARAV